jgi:hypothetical protein
MKLKFRLCTISLKAAVLPGHQLTGPSEEESPGGYTITHVV